MIFPAALLRYLSICILLCASHLLYAQSSENQEEWLSIAYEDIQKSKYKNALYYLKKVLIMNSERSDAHYYSGICYLQLNQFDQAYTHFVKVKQTELSHPEDFHLWMANVYFLKEEFDRAQEKLTLYLEQSQVKYKNEAQNLERYIQNARKYYARRTLLPVVNLGEPINTSSDEYYPSLPNPKSTDLLFATNRNEEETFLYLHERKNNEIFQGNRDAEGIWFREDKIEFPPAESDDKVRLPLQLLNTDVLKNRKYYLFSQDHSLVIREMSQGAWTDSIQAFTEAPSITSLYMAGSFDISPDKSFMIFSTEVDGSSELFMANFKDGKWERPFPLKKLNTPYFELTPQILFDKKSNEYTLYFSSQGHDSMGGFDVFVSHLKKGSSEWSEPENLGYPINTVADEYGFKKYGELGVFASNRQGGFGGEDLYTCFFYETVLLSGKVQHQEDLRPLKKAHLVFSTKGGYTLEAYTDSIGMYEIELTLKDTFEVKVFEDTLLRKIEDIVVNPYLLLGKKEHKQVQNISIPTSVEEEALKIYNDASEGVSYVLDRIFFKSGSADLERKSFPSLKKFSIFLSHHPGIHVEIAGHTDNVGDPISNKELSLKRAEAIRDHLVNEHHIDEHRLQVQGYGDTLPIASNDIEEKGRELNRRIEVKILKGE